MIPMNNRPIIVVIGMQAQYCSGKSRGVEEFYRTPYDLNRSFFGKRVRERLVFCAAISGISLGEFSLCVTTVNMALWETREKLVSRSRCLARSRVSPGEKKIMAARGD